VPDTPARRACCALLTACLLLIGCSAPPPPTGRPLIQPTITPATMGVADPGTLRVLSFNLRRPFLLDGPNHWNLRRDEVVAFLHTQDADLIGTQECVAGQAEDLLAALPRYAMVGAGRDDGRRAGEMCAIFYRRDRFVLRDHGHFWLSDTPHEPGSKSWGALWSRMVTWARLHDRAAGRDLTVFNTHFSVVSAEARRRGARLLRQRMAELAPHGPVIVTGDFNEGADQHAYDRLTADQPLSPGLNDTYRAVRLGRTPEPGTRHGFSGDTGGPRIDWVLASDHFVTQRAEVLTARVRGRTLSDHHPVAADLRYRGNAESMVRANRRMSVEAPSTRAQ